MKSTKEEKKERGQKEKYESLVGTLRESAIKNEIITTSRKFGWLVEVELQSDPAGEFTATDFRIIDEVTKYNGGYLFGLTARPNGILVFSITLAEKVV